MLDPTVQEEATRLPNRRRQQPKVLAALQARDIVLIPLFAHGKVRSKGRLERAGHTRVVEEEGEFCSFCEDGGGWVGRGGGFGGDDGVDGVEDVDAGLGVGGADVEFEGGVGRDDVFGVAGVDGGDGDDGEVERVDLAGYNGLEAENGGGGLDDRIDAAVGG